ncbi:MAG TPA: hypothetical protein VGC27_08710 [Rhizomicrobium sp.]
MIRALIWTPILLVVGALAAIYIAYGHSDPCRALAVEKARRTLGSASGLAEPFTRLGTSQMSSTACARKLIDSWRQRISDGAS